MNWARHCIRIACVAALVIAASDVAVGQSRGNEENAILEAVIVAARAEGEMFSCVLISEGTVDNFVNPGTELLRRLKKKKLDVDSGAAGQCRNPSYVLWVGPIYTEGPRRARVRAGNRELSGSGRPSYSLKKNWLGKWRVENVSGVE